MISTNRTRAFALLVGLVLAVPAWCGAEPQGVAPATPATEPKADDWRPMFDGKALGDWKQSGYGGAGDTEVVEGAIRIPMGVDLSGITWGGEFPTEGYEIELEARRVEGNDFFCGLTFPVGDDPCSFIVGGWGGAIVGLSSIDGDDAANNETTLVRAFKTGQWYAVKVRVLPDEIAGYLNGKEMFSFDPRGKKLSMRRGEIELCMPVGIATFRTESVVRSVRVRRVAK